MVAELESVTAALSKLTQWAESNDVVAKHDEQRTESKDELDAMVKNIKKATEDVQAGTSDDKMNCLDQAAIAAIGNMLDPFEKLAEVNHHQLMHQRKSMKEIKDKMQEIANVQGKLAESLFNESNTMILGTLPN